MGISSSVDEYCSLAWDGMGISSIVVEYCSLAWDGSCRNLHARLGVRVQQLV